MAKKLVRRGRVCGYRPSRVQFEEMLELAQRGIDDRTAEANLVYWHGDQEITPRGKLHKVTPESLEEVIRDAGSNTYELNSLYFNVNQDEPIERAVTIQVGPDGQWTTYEVSSADQTWALGRYHEITEKLLDNRNIYSKAHSARPEIPEKSNRSTWKPGSWEVVDSTGMRLMKGGLWLRFGCYLL